MTFGTYVNTPTKLTLIRLLISPFVLPLLIFYISPLNNIYLNSLLALLFILISLTDFFDGYLARRYRQETKIGKSLDHIADKFLVYATLVALLAVKKIFFYWVIVLIGREFFVLGLRIIALEHDLEVAVSTFGKLKTATQMIWLTFLLVVPNRYLIMNVSPFWATINSLLITLTLGFSIYSAYAYGRAFYTKLKNYRAL